MNKLMLISLIFLLFVACTVEENVTKKKSPANSNNNIDEQTAIEKEILMLFNSQVNAFNNQDINRLVENVSEDFKYFYITSNDLILEVEGKEQFRQSMEAYFKSGHQTTSKVQDYILTGNRISFKEVVSYKDKAGKQVSSSAMAIYEIKANKITRTWYFVD